MLISKKHRFIFVHIYKNAGSSITEALKPVIAQEWRWQINPIFRKLKISALNLQPFSAHVNTQAIIDKLGKDVFDSYFSFAIVRNPWDWQVSLFKYMQKNEKHHQHELAVKFQSFDEYIEWRCAEEVRFQKDFIYSRDGELLVDFVGKLENLEQDFAEICKRIDIPSIQLPRVNVSNTEPYQNFYNDRTREMVKAAFEPDISLFNYSF